MIGSIFLHLGEGVVRYEDVNATMCQRLYSGGTLLLIMGKEAATTSRANAETDDSVRWLSGLISTSRLLKQLGHSF
jgi:hypothetical protein